MTMLWNKNFQNPFLLDWDYDICEHASISKDEFLPKLRVNHAENQSIEKRTRKQIKRIKRIERTQKKTD